MADAWMVLEGIVDSTASLLRFASGVVRLASQCFPVIRTVHAHWFRVKSTRDFNPAPGQLVCTLHSGVLETTFRRNTRLSHQQHMENST